MLYSCQESSSTSDFDLKYIHHKPRPRKKMATNVEWQIATNSKCGCENEGWQKKATIFRCFFAFLHLTTRELITSHKEPHLSRSNGRVAGWHHGRRMHHTVRPLPLPVLSHRSCKLFFLRLNVVMGGKNKWSKDPMDLRPQER